MLLWFRLGANAVFGEATNARPIVMFRSLAALRTSATRVAGIVTLCRTDLAGADLRVVIMEKIAECTSVAR